MTKKSERKAPTLRAKLLSSSAPQNSNHQEQGPKTGKLGDNSSMSAETGTAMKKKSGSVASAGHERSVADRTRAGPRDPDKPIRFLRRPEVCHITGLSTSTLYALMQKPVESGGFPRPIPLTNGARPRVAWPEDWVVAWQAKRIAEA